MEPVRLYTYLTAARARVLGWVRPLTAEQYTREFPMGPGSLAKTFNHIVIAEWYYVLRMLERETPPVAQIIARDEHPQAFADLEATWSAQAEETRAAIAGISDWGQPIRYTVEREGKTVSVHTTRGDIFTQLVLHEVHHRAQVLNMLRHLGVKTEDIDFNTMMYKITEAPSG